MTPPPEPYHVSAKVVVRNNDGRRLLLRRSLHGRLHPGQWELPGGKVDPGERIDEALLREVWEETGLRIRLERVVGSSQSRIEGKQIAYLFFDALHLSGKVRISQEHQAYRWVKLEEFLTHGDLARLYHGFAESYCRGRGYSPHKSEPKRPQLSFRELQRYVRAYVRVLPRYRRLAVVLHRVLQDEIRRISPLAVVQVRPKSVASFAEKILRKNKYTDPLRQITDLCGARVITQLKSEAEAACRFIRDHFIVDEANSVDALARLRPSEFGYRSVHYVVQFQPGRFPHVSRTLWPLKAEIQVRTLLQHAWSDVGHDRLYKSGYEVPEVWEREAARVAAMLENADDAFGHIVDGLEEFNCEFGAYLTPHQREREVAILRTQLRHDRTDSAAAHRLARILMTLGDWPEVIRLVERVPARWHTGDLLCCLGSALCELHRRSRRSREFQRGRELLRRSAQLSPTRVEAHLKLAETAASGREQLRHFHQAFEADSTDPAALAGYVRQKILVEGSVGFVCLLRPEIEAAITKCRRQVEAGVNLPWAYYRLAAFHLLLGADHQRDALTACAHGVRRTTAVGMLNDAIDAAAMFARILPNRTDAQAVLRFLLAARQAKFPGSDQARALRRLATQRCSDLKAPVLIIAGGCDPARTAEMRRYSHLLRAALSDFRGTIISGGTRQGISGLVGEIGTASGGRLSTVGYLPSPLPRDGSASPDHRYGELRWTDGSGAFSVIEPLQGWVDLVVSGVSPSQVHLLGINGGYIAALEYRLAWGLGAKVAIVRDSGREADVLEQEIKANEFEGMFVLPPDAMTLRAFVHLGAAAPPPLNAIHVERLARILHARYLEEGRHRLGDRTMREWEYLDDDIQDSNRQKVAYLPQILAAVGCRIAPVAEGEVPAQFSDEELEIMGEMEHGRWNVERLSQGWHYARERDPEQRLSPHLVPWDTLDTATQSWDQKGILKFAEVLPEVGMQIVRDPQKLSRNRAKRTRSRGSSGRALSGASR